ncbi:MAG: CYTH domain-containing protein [Thermodesulfovibrionales bacterium]|nr:CYTH domain-containing protein [Thermodesulfovibrionales bacterium]
MIISEKERKILINAPDGQRASQEIIELHSLQDFHFEGSSQLKIQDSYLDSKDFILAKRNNYIRLRGKKTGRLITIRLIKDGIIDEITHPLNDEGLGIALNVLAENYEELKTPQLTLPNFLEIFQSIGLNEVLRVTLDRIERDIFLEDLKIGKMKIDVYQYIFPNTFGPFFELELNSYKKAFHKHVDDLIELILKKMEGIVELSELSKYSRGINITYGFNYK